MNPVFKGKVEQGKLHLKSREQFDNFLHSMTGDVEVVVRRPRKDRSNRQNAYYFGVVIKILGDHLGYFPNQMHEILKFKFLMLDDGRYKYVRSTTSLSTVEWEDYMSKIRMWASSEHECYIPKPNQVDICDTI